MVFSSTEDEEAYGKLWSFIIPLVAQVCGWRTGWRTTRKKII